LSKIINIMAAFVLKDFIYLLKIIFYQKNKFLLNCSNIFLVIFQKNTYLSKIIVIHNLILVLSQKLDFLIFKGKPYL